MANVPIHACYIWLSLLLLVPAPAAAEAPRVNWGERVEVAAGDAYQGHWRMNESEFLYVDDATVAMNDRGIIGVAWADNARQDIYFQAFDADGDRRLEAPVNVSRSPDIFSWLPRMIIGADNADEIHILWQEIVFSGGSHGGEIFFARSTDGGNSFSDPINLSNTTAGAGKGRLSERHWHNGSLDLAQGPDGSLYAAWTEYEGRLRFSRSDDGGKQFSEPLHVAGDGTLPARGPSLAVDGDRIHLAWTIGEVPGADIHITSSGDRGQSFSEPRAVHNSSGHADAPKLAADGDGTLHLVYGESPDGPWQRYHILYSRAVGDAFDFDPPRAISTVEGRGAAGGENFPALALDGAGGLYVLWERFPNRRSRSQGLGFTYSTDGGENFVSPAVIPGSDDPALGINGSLQGLLMNKLAANADGQLAVVNSTFNPGESSHIWLTRGQIER